ncbi:MAG: ATP-binding protein, partial [Ignavibacteria bacterium]|nr:ATP-binding protein [Ignavibacteria bacterium]
MVNGVETVKAGPTKDFFVSMITRDIQLPDAIVELIDNSIDGIKRQKAEKYDGYFIKVRFNKDFFEIEDNCGGISLQIAKEYAFVFGKPRSAREKEERVETTGTFGIGMKRALFKMGQKFEIQSRAKDSSFRLSIDVIDWMGKSDWDFPLTESDSAETNDVKICGTKITVTLLHPAISHSFEFIPFANEVINIVQRRTNAEIINGLKITINDIVIGGSFLTIINSDRVFPY